MDERAPSVGDRMHAALREVRRLAAEVDDARLTLERLEKRLQAAAIDAAVAHVPKSTVAEAARVSRPTLYSWLDHGV